eukprot:GGOE01006825.1.p1 GENE.GGOE01006825.1~~GGOE01006825.1.p1  ORF type:complete len:560 (-),score=24.82 GGOE01006825.1:442-2073(-)
MAHGVGRSSSPALQTTQGAKPLHSGWQRPREAVRSPMRTWSDLAPPSDDMLMARQQQGHAGRKAPSSPAARRRTSPSAASQLYTPMPHAGTPLQGGWLDVQDGYVVGLLTPEVLTFDNVDAPALSPPGFWENCCLSPSAESEPCPPSPPPESPATHNACPAAETSVESTGTQADPLACLHRGPIERMPIPPSGRKPVEFYARLAAAAPGSAVFDGQYRPAHFLPPTDFPTDQLTPPSASRRGLQDRRRPLPSPEQFGDAASSSTEWIPGHQDEPPASYHPCGLWADHIDIGSSEFPSHNRHPQSPRHPWQSPSSPSPERRGRAAEPRLSAPGQVIYGECQACHLVEPVPHGWLPDHYWDVGVLRWCAACGRCTTWLGLDTNVRPSPSSGQHHPTDRSWSDIAVASGNGAGWLYPRREVENCLPHQWDGRRRPSIGGRHQAGNGARAAPAEWDVVPVRISRGRGRPPPTGFRPLAPRPRSSQRDRRPMTDAVKTVEECDICMERAKDHCLDPCGHRYCGLCIATLRSRVCPVCNCEFVKAIKLY